MLLVRAHHDRRGPVPRGDVGPAVPARRHRGGHPAAGLAAPRQPRRPDPPPRRLGALDQRRTEALIERPGGDLRRSASDAVDDVTAGVLRLGAARARRGRARARWCWPRWCSGTSAGSPGPAVIALAVTGGSLGLAAGTVQPDSIAEPRYEGLLVNAPAVVGDARRIADNYGRYADQLQQLVSNVSRIYTTVSTLPVYEPAANTTRILHVSDLHLNPAAWGLIRTVVADQFDIDAVVDTGDIIDWGSERRGDLRVGRSARSRCPYIYVRGNHDSAAIQAAVARQPNAIVLDDTITTVDGLTIAGIGDPRFTPDKTHRPADRRRAAPAVGQRRAAGLDDPRRAASRSTSRWCTTRRWRRRSSGVVPAGARRAPAQARGQHAARTGAATAPRRRTVPARPPQPAMPHPADGGGLHRRRRAARAGEREAHAADAVGPLLRRGRMRSRRTTTSSWAAPASPRWRCNAT